MKKAFAILLTAIMMLYSVGYYFIYKARVSEVKEVNQASLSSGRTDHPLTFITATLNNGHISEAAIQVISKYEMTCNGKLYDIVSFERNGDKITFACVSDEKENNMIASANDHTQKQADHGNGKKASSEVTIDLYLEQATIYKSFITGKSERQIPVTINLLPVPYCNIPSPPPWA